jgi:quercetin dioxygenase-like cupin family protein
MTSGLEDRDSRDTCLYQSILYRIQLGRLNDCFNLLHLCLSFLPASNSGQLVEHLSMIPLTVQHPRSTPDVFLSLLRYSFEMPDELLYTRWSDVPVTQLNPLLTRQYVTGSQSMFARLELKKGCIVPRHQHPNEQITYITQGALLFVLGEEGSTVEKIVREGEILVIPGNVPHSAEAIEDTVDFDIFAPPRQDWLTNDDAYLR